MGTDLWLAVRLDFGLSPACTARPVLSAEPFFALGETNYCLVVVLLRWRMIDAVARVVTDVAFDHATRERMLEVDLRRTSQYCDSRRPWRVTAEFPNIVSSFRLHDGEATTRRLTRVYL